jgi:hypothetical protein
VGLISVMRELGPSGRSGGDFGLPLEGPDGGSIDIGRGEGEARVGYESPSERVIKGRFGHRGGMTRSSPSGVELNLTFGHKTHFPCYRLYTWYVPVSASFTVELTGPGLPC